MLQYWIGTGIFAVSQFLDTPCCCDCLGWLVGFSYLQPRFGELGAVLLLRGSLMCCNTKSMYSGLWKICNPVFLQDLEFSAAASAVFLMAQYLSHFASKSRNKLFLNFLLQWILKNEFSGSFPPHWYLSWCVNCVSSLLAAAFFLLVASLPTHVFASSNSEPFCMYELSSKEFLHIKCWEKKLLHVAPYKCVSS